MAPLRLWRQIPFRRAPRAAPRPRVHRHGTAAPASTTSAASAVNANESYFASPEAAALDGGIYDGAAAVTVPPEVTGWLVDAAELLAEPDPGPTPWLVDELIVDRAIVAAVGRWKTTKSY